MRAQPSMLCWAILEVMVGGRRAVLGPVIGGKVLTGRTDSDTDRLAVGLTCRTFKHVLKVPSKVR